MNLNLLTFRGTPSPSSLLPPPPSSSSSLSSQYLDSFYSIPLDGCHIQPLNIQLFPWGRKTGQSWVRNGWIVDFCPKWHRPYLARLTTSYYVRTFLATTWAGQKTSAFNAFAAKCYKGAFECEGGTDQGLDQLVDQGDSLWEAGQGLGETWGGQLAMQRRWRWDDWWWQ